MPLYEYRCPDGHVQELLRDVSRASDAVLCTECSQVAHRIYSGSRLYVSFRGSGFYSTDYGRSAASADD